MKRSNTAPDLTEEGKDRKGKDSIFLIDEKLVEHTEGFLTL